jgi:hypothetical protein
MIGGQITQPRQNVQILRNTQTIKNNRGGRTDQSKVYSQPGYTENSFGH